MTFRAIVQDGYINTRGRLPDGTPVTVVPDRAPRATKSRANKSRKSSHRSTPLSELPAIGMWKNRPDWKGKSTAQIARALREKSLGGRRRG